MHPSALRDGAVRFIVDSDPGRLRLRSAAVTTLSLVLAIVALLTFTRYTHQPVTVAMLGAIVAMQSSAAVKDKQQHDRVITTLLLPLPAVAAVALAAVLAPFDWVADVGFIIVLFLAVWVRRFGPRGNALGMVAFMAYFFALFIHAAPAQIPILAAAVGFGVCATLFVRVVILPDRPRAEVVHLVRALRGVSITVLDAVTKDRKRHDLAAVRRRLDRLGETGLMIDDWLDRHDAAATLSVTSDELALRVFDAQISVEQLAGLLWGLDAAGEWTGGLVDAVIALRMCLQDHPTQEELRAARKSAAAAADRADVSAASGIATVVAYRAVQAHLAIHHITTNALGVSPGPQPAPEPEAGHEDEDEATGLDPSTKAAIQVAVATSAATVLGELISPDRWYWAVLTAFLVFTGVSTRGEILTRAGHRIVGTIAGVVAGVVLATLIGQNQPVQILVLVVCVFCAFYLVTVAYAWLTFFVTVVLAMLYGLLGNFSIQVLELRIAETAAGGAVGIASAYFVFTTGTRATFVEKAGDYFDRLTEVIDAGIASVLAPGGETDLVAETRSLDNALQEVVKAGKPLQFGPAVRSRRGAQRLVRGLRAGNRSAHALARAGVNAARADPATAPSESTAIALRKAADHVCDTVAGVGRMIAAGDTGAQDKAATNVIAEVMTTSGIPPGPVRAAVRALNNLDRTLTEVTSRV
ncbi:FUSC family protein [Mycolicibacterium fluoranthenivorans]|uniref:FUSC family protein n=1 Tax=Mycolicibacterium fluoranthenivorans TaxID=258505 RepID=A0A7G8P966_9MYCO|nr:FUSC family protein [Mycolicibacterium fluoranthenivorans]QNJ90882.1 FUSC family protein [Mycolicibacterium fluoranthenivorans]